MIEPNTLIADKVKRLYLLNMVKLLSKMSKVLLEKVEFQNSNLFPNFSRQILIY